MMFEYLVDSNVLCEPTKVQSHPHVNQWLAEQALKIAVNPIILGEIKNGILKLDDGRKKTLLQDWFNEGIQLLHCLPIQRQTALIWADLIHALRKAGKAMQINDSLIAATALEYDLTVITRNTSDFEFAGVKLFNPFES